MSKFVKEDLDVLESIMIQFFPTESPEKGDHRGRATEVVNGYILESISKTDKTFDELFLEGVELYLRAGLCYHFATPQQFKRVGAHDALYSKDLSDLPLLVHRGRGYSEVDGTLKFQDAFTGIIATWRMKIGK